MSNEESLVSCARCGNRIPPAGFHRCGGVEAARSWPLAERIALRLILWSVRRRVHDRGEIRVNLQITETTPI